MGGYLYLMRLVMIIIFIYCILLKNAYAYLDPGTGSYFFQLIIAAILGGLFAIKLSWHRIKNFLLRNFSRKRQKDNGKQE